MKELSAKSINQHQSKSINQHQSNTHFLVAFILLAVTALMFSNNVKAAKLPDFVELAEKSQPSVVSISTEIKVRQRNFFSRRPSNGSRRGPSGSGFIISKDGYVITNNHVVEGVEKVFVRLHTGNHLEAEIVGTDAETDIALLKIDANKLTKNKNLYFIKSVSYHIYFTQASLSFFTLKST